MQETQIIVLRICGYGHCFFVLFLSTKIQVPDFLQNQLAFSSQTTTFMSLPSEPLMLSCYQPSPPALDTDFPSCSASTAD